MPLPVPDLAVIGGGGRIGRPLVAALGPRRVLGIGRRGVGLWIGRWAMLQRQNRSELRAALAGARAIVDLCCFDEADADTLLACADRRVPLVLASSIAEREPDFWRHPESQLGPLPQDPYGAGKRAASELLLKNWRGPVLVALLPQILSLDDPDERALTYLREGANFGAVVLPGTGNQRIATLEARTVADLACRWLRAPVNCGRVQLGTPDPPPLRELVAKLLQGAEMDAELQQGADQGPHSAGDEKLNLDRQTAIFGRNLARPLADAFADLGAVWRTNDFPDWI